MTRKIKLSATVNPTKVTYDGLDGAYDWFNTVLFDGTLPRCLITLQRKNGSFGYWGGERFGTRDGSEKHDEIALNPVHFKERTVEQILSTLAHEMCHLWQAHHGTLPRSGYHDRQWAAKMVEIGLQPTDTGAPGGKVTGQKMTHLIIDGGPFADAAAALLKRGWTQPYVSLWEEGAERARTAAVKRASKTKFSCPCCGNAAWGKPDLKIVCGDCDKEMAA
jgi:SprT-like family